MAINPITGLEDKTYSTNGLINQPVPTTTPSITLPPQTTPPLGTQAQGLINQPTQIPATQPVATVEQGVQGIIAQNSPLQQLAETRSNQKMNQTGVLNSTMAIGAGQAALYDAAVPIAASDAQAKNTAQRDTFQVQANKDAAATQVEANKAAAQFDVGVGQALAQTNFENQRILNKSAHANSYLNNYTAQLNSIAMSSTLDPQGKIDAQNRAFDQYKKGLAFISSVDNVQDISSLVGFGPGGEYATQQHADAAVAQQHADAAALAANPDPYARGKKVTMGTFNEAKYLASNPDVLAFKAGALEHFKQYGAGEGRMY